MLRIVLAVLHLLALGIGLGAIHARARALNAVASTNSNAPDTAGALARALTADAWWGVAALLWLGTGLWRAIGGTEKASGYYWSNHVFHAKIGLFLLVVLLELWPARTLGRWRRESRRGALAPLDALAPTARRIARISDLQSGILVAIVLAAVMMARGYGA